jgi:hypothetical protein
MGIARDPARRGWDLANGLPENSYQAAAEDRVLPVHTGPSPESCKNRRPAQGLWFDQNHLRVRAIKKSRTDDDGRSPGKVKPEMLLKFLTSCQPI